jgi:DNA-directed RNA polymerase specialized sigma24 family protein
VLITPLRKRSADGGAYFRPPAIEELLAALSQMTIEEVARRARIDGHHNMEYVPSECLVYFVRQSKYCGDDDAYRDIFVSLRQRLLQSVPVYRRKVREHLGFAEKAADLDVQEAVLHAFQELLCTDRDGYDERLDFFEIRFNAAVAKLRATARKKIGRYESRRQSLANTGEGAGSYDNIEQSLARLKNQDEDVGDDCFCRLRLHAAINTLPVAERRVVELLLQEIPIDSQDDRVLTITKILGCVEKTVRNRRDRAFARIRDALNEEEGV